MLGHSREKASARLVGWHARLLSQAGLASGQEDAVASMRTAYNDALKLCFLPSSLSYYNSFFKLTLLLGEEEAIILVHNICTYNE